jgi:hypothetical protein
MHTFLEQIKQIIIYTQHIYEFFATKLTFQYCVPLCNLLEAGLWGFEEYCFDGILLMLDKILYSFPSKYRLSSLPI